MKKYTGTFAAVMLIVMCTVYSRAAAQGVYEGVVLCANSLIPSLFPMLFASVFMVENGSARIIGKWLSPITQKLFALPGEAATAVVASVTGGYPAGASAISSLYENGMLTKAQARRAAYFCVCAGPGFLIGAVGGAMLGLPAVGALLLAIQISSVIISGVVLRFVYRKEEDLCSGEMAAEKNNMAQALTVSVRSAGESMLMICAYVLLAGALGGVLEAAGITASVSAVLQSLGMETQTAQAVMPAVIEVGSGCAAARFAGIPMLAFTVGFGGLAVHMQIFSILSKIKISLLPFMAVRLMCGLYCSAAAKLFVPMLPNDAVSAAVQYSPQLAQKSVAGSAALIIMCLMCVLCIPRTKCKSVS